MSNPHCGGEADDEAIDPTPQFYPSSDPTRQAPHLDMRRHALASDGLSQVNPNRSQEDEDKIRLAREAFGRRQQDSFEDWMVIAEGLDVGRREAMAAAKTHTDRSPRYRKAIAAWLIANGLDKIDKAVRCRLLKMLPHRAEIEKWRATLATSERRRYNHPNTIWRKWEQSKGRSKVRGSKKQRRNTKKGLEAEVARLDQENAALLEQINNGAADSTVPTKSGHALIAFKKVVDRYWPNMNADDRTAAATYVSTKSPE